MAATYFQSYQFGLSQANRRNHSLLPSVNNKPWETCRRCFPTTSMDPFQKRWRAGASKGDSEIQDTLVEILRLESQKVHVTEYVEQKKKLITDISEEYKEEYQKVRDKSMKALEEVGVRIMEQVDLDCRDIEARLSKSREEIERREREFEEYEEQLVAAQNEALFFKNLYTTSRPKKPLDPDTVIAIKKEKDAVEQISMEEVKKSPRRILFGALAVLSGVCALQSMVVEDAQWWKIALYSGIFLSVLSRLTYEVLLFKEAKKD